jgi:hypothetical protein
LAAPTLLQGAAFFIAGVFCLSDRVSPWRSRPAQYE